LSYGQYAKFTRGGTRTEVGRLWPER